MHPLLNKILDPPLLPYHRGAALAEQSCRNLLNVSMVFLRAEIRSILTISHPLFPKLCADNRARENALGNRLVVKIIVCRRYTPGSNLGHDILNFKN